MKLAPPTSRLICFTESDCNRARNKLLRSVIIANDIETIPFNKKDKGKKPFVLTINCYTGLMADGTFDSYCFPFQNTKDWRSGAPTHIESIFDTCRIINDSGIPFIGQNYVYDLLWNLRYLIPVRNWAHDSMVAFWAKWPELPKRLDFIASILLDDYQYWKAERKSDDFIAYCNYGMSDTEYTLRNMLELIHMMFEDPKMLRNYHRGMTRSMAAFHMSAKGMKANMDVMNQFEKDLSKKAEEALSRCRYVVADPEFNPNSPQQKSRLIYDLLGAKPRTAKGKFAKKSSDSSTGANALRAIRADHPIFRRISNVILEAIEPAKQLSNVVGLEFLNGRFYTAYDGVATTTTRLGSRKCSFGHGGNAQNIRKDYRRFLQADKDSFLFDIDFSGSDDYYIGYESGDPVKIALLESGKDIHSSNATIFFRNWTYDAVVAGKAAKDERVVHPITGIRQITKKLCHGMSFLMAGTTLLMTAGREAIVAAAIEEGYKDAGYWNQTQLVHFCAMLEERFRAHYPRLKRVGPDSWYTDLRAEVMRTGGFETIFRYFQRFLGDTNDDSTLRAVAASAGQANTAGRVNMVMDELLFGIRNRRFRDGPAPDSLDDTRIISEEANGIGLRLQTHDSLTFNIRYTHPNWKQGVENIWHSMRRPVLCKERVFSVGTEAEVSYYWAGKESRVVKGIADIEKFLNEVPPPDLTETRAKPMLLNVA